MGELIKIYNGSLFPRITAKTSDWPVDFFLLSHNHYLQLYLFAIIFVTSINNITRVDFPLSELTKSVSSAREASSFHSQHWKSYHADWEGGGMGTALEITAPLLGTEGHWNFMTKHPCSSYFVCLWPVSRIWKRVSVTTLFTYTFAFWGDNSLTSWLLHNWKFFLFFSD